MDKQRGADGAPTRDYLAELSRYLGEQFQCFCLVAFDFNDNGVKIVHTPRSIDVYAIQQAMEDAIEQEFKMPTEVKVIEEGGDD